MKTEMRKIGSVQGYNQKLNEYGEPFSGKSSCLLWVVEDSTICKFIRRLHEENALFP